MLCVVNFNIVDPFPTMFVTAWLCEGGTDHWQWWSMRWTHWWQRLQWWARGGFLLRHVSQYPTEGSAMTTHNEDLDIW